MSILIFLYILICFGLIVSILLQSSKGGGLAAGAFGGGGDVGAVFGGRGAGTFLSRMTTVLATLFLAASILISFVNQGDSGGSGLIQQEQQKRSSSIPASVPLVPSENQQGAVQPQNPTQMAPAPASPDSGQ